MAKWYSEAYVTGYNKNIPQDYDITAFRHAPRVYEWTPGKSWKTCSREYVVGDDDYVYSEKGEKVMFANSNKSKTYYILDPESLGENKDSLPYFKVKSISFASPTSKIPVSKLRFVGVPLKFVFFTPSVTFSDIFEFYEPDNVGDIDVFVISHSRSVFSYLYKEVSLPTFFDKDVNVDDLFKFYDTLSQFSNVLSETIDDVKKYSKDFFDSALVKKRSFTNDEKKSLIEKKKFEITEKSKKQVKKITKKLDKLEEKSYVRKFAELFDQKKGKVGDLKALPLEGEAKKDVKKWIRLHDKLDDLTELKIKVELEKEDLIEPLKSEINQITRMILEEYLPEGSEDDEELIDDDISHASHHSDSEEDAEDETTTEESDEDLQLYDSDEEEYEDGDSSDVFEKSSESDDEEASTSNEEDVDDVEDVEDIECSDSSDSSDESDESDSDEAKVDESSDSEEYEETSEGSSDEDQLSSEGSESNEEGE